MIWSCHGVPTGILTNPERAKLTERFWSHVDRWFDGDGCWNWTGCVCRSGYGLFCIPKENRKKANRYTHRIAFELANERPVADGKVLDHRCRNHRCVRPSHLREVTPAENIHAPGSRSVAKKKAEQTHCKNGHEFSYARNASRPNGYRLCLTCVRARRMAAREASERKPVTTDNDKETDR